MKKLSFAAALSIGTMFTASAWADCISGDCASLGYSTADVPDCENYIYCPFDINYKICAHVAPKLLDSCPAGKTCVEKYRVSGDEAACSTGYKKTVTECGTLSNGYYTLGIAQSTNAACKQCVKNCNSDYELKDGSCSKKTESCTYGSIYYSDKTCSSSVLSGKTPIGIVVLPKSSTGTGFVISLEEQDKVWASSSYATTDVSCMSEDWSGDEVGGTTNTSCLVRTGDYPAAKYCNSYSTAGTTSGKWFLPAAGELQSAMEQKDEINAGLRKINKSILNSTFYWSSSEYMEPIAWGYDMNQKESVNNRKDISHTVRCFLEF